MNESFKAIMPGVGGVAAAAGSAVCCAGPVIAVSLGVSGAGLSAFEPWRPYHGWMQWPYRSSATSSARPPASSVTMVGRKYSSHDAAILIIGVYCGSSVSVGPK